MNDSRIRFFADEGRRQIVATAVTKIQSALDTNRDGQDRKYKFLLEFVGVTLFNIRNSPDSFDERCIMNISILGDRFMTELNKLSLNPDDMEHLFSYCYRFLIEYQLSTPQSLGSDMLEVLSKVSDFEFSGMTYSQIRYASHQMLINVAQHYIYHPSLVSLKELPDVIQRSERERKIAEEKIQERETRVAALAEKLEVYETAFNFVGLYAGFQSMRATKSSEKNWNFTYLIALGVLLLLPFACKIYLMFHPLPNFQIDIAGIATLVGAELLLVYFFRVALHNFRSIKAQLLQIDLRMTLCQFVQSYAEYASNAKKDSAGLLEKFEQIVFSGIVNDESAIPSTFDGLDQMVNLIEKIRK